MAYSKNHLTRELNARIWMPIRSTRSCCASTSGTHGGPLSGSDRAAPLRRQIIGTMVSNSMINRGGITFAYRAFEETGPRRRKWARAYSVSRAVFDLPVLASDRGLGQRRPTAAQAALHLEVRRLLDRSTRWFLTTRGGRLDVTGEIARFAEPVRELGPLVPEVLVGQEAARLALRTDEFVALGAPRDLARDVAALLDVFSLLDIVQVGLRYDEDPAEVTRLYFAMSERFGVDALLNEITKLSREDRWDALARSALRSDLYGALAGLTAWVLRSTPTGRAGRAHRRLGAGQCRGSGTRRATLTEIIASGSHSLATISVALRVIRTLVYQGTGE